MERGKGKARPSSTVTDWSDSSAISTAFVATSGLGVVVRNE